MLKVPSAISVAQPCITRAATSCDWHGKTCWCVGQNWRSEAGSCSISQEMLPVGLENLMCLKAGGEKTTQEILCVQTPWQFVY